MLFYSVHIKTLEEFLKNKRKIDFLHVTESVNSASNSALNNSNLRSFGIF